MEKQVGDYAFIIGVIIAIVLGLAASSLGAAADILSLLLVVLGIAVGFLNVTAKETKDFLWVTVALVVVASLGSAEVKDWEKLRYISPYLSAVFNSILVFVVPASVVVALKSVWEMAKTQ